MLDAPTDPDHSNFTHAIQGSWTNTVRQCPLSPLKNQFTKNKSKDHLVLVKTKKYLCMTQYVEFRNQTPNLEIWTPNQKSKLQMRYLISNRELQPQVSKLQIQVQIETPNSELDIRNPNSNITPRQQHQSRNQKSSPKSKLTNHKSKLEIQFQHRDSNFSTSKSHKSKLDSEIRNHLIQTQKSGLQNQDFCLLSLIQS